MRPETRSGASGATTWQREQAGAAGVPRALDRYIFACLILDTAAIVLALALAEYLRHSLPYGRQLGNQNYVNASVYALAIGCWLASAWHFNLYQWRWLVNLQLELGRLLATVGGFSLLFAAALYLSYRDVPRLLFLYYAPLALLAVLLQHILVRGVFALLPIYDTVVRIAIVGTGRVAETLAGRIAARSRHWPPVAIAGFITTEPTASPAAPGTANENAGYPVLGPVGSLTDLVIERRITTVLLALPPEQHALALEVSTRLKHLAIDVRLLPDMLDLASARATIEWFEGLPLLGLRDPALSLPDRLMKYTFDRVAATLGLLAISPLLLLVALAIKLDSPGPVFYRAQRIGEGGKAFAMLKFRSMEIGAEARLAEVLGASGLGRGIYKVPGDPRVTRLGRFLRRTSIDELPNLWNVLRGEMSIVGPRPEQPFIVESYQPWQHRRTNIRPGMTGWWQINGRSDKPLHQNTDFDLYYLENYSFWLDLRILARTVGVVIRARGAY